MSRKPDFSGWATKYNVKCGDGRTLLDGAFADQDGVEVPLVWNHQHGGAENILGHALLKSVPGKGIRSLCFFNDSDNAIAAKEAVRHGDVKSLSIWANKLQEVAGNVSHGIIREVSLVLAGANPEARIDSYMEHSGFGDDGIEALIYTAGDESINMYHSDDEGESFEETPESEEILEHAEDDSKKSESNIMEKVKKDIDSMTKDQKDAMYVLIGAITESMDSSDDEYDEDDEDDEDDENGGNNMKHNVFDSDEQVLSHGIGITVQELIEKGRSAGGLQRAWIAHCEEMQITEEEGDALMHAEHSSDTPTRYGIMPKMNGTTVVPGSLGIEALFPDAKYINGMPPEFIKRDTGWVAGVMSGVSRSPFARFKTIFADITEDEARARGYIKGKYKKEEVFSLLKREISPQTIYKKQRFDRDDLTDITDFDVLAWVKAEMRMMLDEEIGRAILVGDGRLDSSEDKISETHVKSIYHEDDFYADKVAVQVASDADEATISKETIKAVIRARKNYKGSGNPTFYTTADVLTEMLLLEDGIGHRLYKTEQELATALRVSKIVEVEVMENLTRTDTSGTSSVTRPLIGIVVNLSDYRVGADKGGAVSMFEDFDIDYNQQKFLIETRISGMLVKPHSAMVIELEKSASVAEG